MIKLTDTQQAVIDNRLASFPGETWEQIVKRVVAKVAMAEPMKTRDEFIKDATYIIGNMWFLPNSPCLRNFGANDGNGSACFVLPIEDSRESIFDTLKNAVEVQAMGGGTGFNFSEIRPRGSLIKSTKGRASGPISFMEVFDFTVGNVIAQGGVRKGANMGILDISHPDVIEFISCKKEEGRLKNFNISIGITDDFMRAYFNDTEWVLSHPSVSNTTVVRARTLMNLIVKNAWENGEPGLVFLDTINKDNNYEAIKATNPCGEQPLAPYVSCNLGSLNLRAIPHSKLKFAVRAAIRFLDNVIDVNPYPLKKIEDQTKKYRNIGLGVMGYHDWLIKLGLKYGEPEADYVTKELFRVIQKEAMMTSANLAHEKGSAPVHPGRRNSKLTTIAPTGTLSMLADCSGGIEPYFGFQYDKRCMDKTVTVTASIVDEAPIKSKLITAHEVHPQAHLRIQGLIQKYIDAGISKTINLPNHATQEDVEELYADAWKIGCKGITVYRDGCRLMQAQTVKRCPDCGSSLVLTEGCLSCSDKECGYAACSI